jgi:hypothetical protein
MHILVAGGTGYLGGALVRALRSKGQRVTVITRRPDKPDQISWPAPGDRRWAALIGEAGAIVNLAGAPIVGPRWTDARKALIRESRVAATRLLVNGILAAPKPPVLINGSAIGFYGPRGDDPVGETGMPGSDFLASVVVEWERAAMEAAHATRVVCLRTGVVLSRDGGALPKLALPFRFFAGGRIGTGAQYVSWIHRDDWVAMVEWALTTNGVTGPLNATAPQPVTNAELATAIGAALGRPALVPAPAFAVRLALGEMGDAAILTGQRVIPEKAQALGFKFKYSTIDRALKSIYAFAT